MDSCSNDLRPLSWLIGKWTSCEACVSYPSMEPMSYEEELEFMPVSGQPVLKYNSQTYNNSKQKILHCEKGYLRINPGTQDIAFMVAHNFGVTELSEGEVTNDGKVHLKSTAINQMSFCKANKLKSLSRLLKLEDDCLVSEVDMETINEPLQKHLRVRYKRK